VVVSLDRVQLIMGDFPGFSLPAGAWLPPELLWILPEIGTMSELKVTIAAIHETLRVGVVEAVVSLSEFEALTGLDRKSVSRGIKAALERGTFKRQQVGNTWLYRLHFRDPSAPAAGQNGRGKMPLVGGEMGGVGGEMPQEGGAVPLDVVMHDTLSVGDKQHQGQRAAILGKMADLGVRLKVAQHMVAKYDLAYLGEKLDQALFAVDQGLADNGPGWFVASVREDWQAPLGYGDRDKPRAGSREDRLRYIEGKYKDLIEH
jgi:hypothetical protein